MPLFELIKCKYYSPLCNKDTKRRTTYEEGFFSLRETKHSYIIFTGKGLLHVTSSSGGTINHLSKQLTLHQPQIYQFVLYSIFLHSEAIRLM